MGQLLPIHDMCFRALRSTLPARQQLDYTRYLRNFSKKTDHNLCAYTYLYR
jgi:hypothetical protein